MSYHKPFEDINDELLESQKEGCVISVDTTVDLEEE